MQEIKKSSTWGWGEYRKDLKSANLMAELHEAIDVMGAARLLVGIGLFGLGAGMATRRLLLEGEAKPKRTNGIVKAASGTMIGVGALVSSVGIAGEFIGRKFVSLIREEQASRNQR